VLAIVATDVLDLENHIASSGTAVHGLGTMSTENATDYVARSKIVLGTPATVVASDTIAISVTGSYVKITDDGVDADNAISFAAGTEGQIIYVFNGDASPTSGIATISSLGVGSVIYASATWCLLEDE
jgi:hypothetical protein